MTFPNLQSVLYFHHSASLTEEVNLKADPIFEESLKNNKTMPTPENEVVDCRPSNAPDADANMWFKAVGQSQSKEVGTIVEPQQLAVGTPSGIQIKMVSIRLEQEVANIENDQLMAIIAKTLDMLNAHNTYKRRLLLQKLLALKERQPHLKPIISAIISVMECKSEIFVRTSKGLDLLCYSEEGGPQGNAITNIAFAIILDDTLKRASEKYINVVVRAIQDDITVSGPEDQVEGPEGAWEFLKQDIKRETGCDIGDGKTKKVSLTHPKEDQLSNLSFIENEASEKLYGMEVCSIPIGSDEYILYKINQKADEIIEKISSITERFAAKDAHLAFNVVKLSLQNLADYTNSIIEPRFLHDFRDKIDTALISAFSLTIGAEIDDADLYTNEKHFTDLRFRLRAKNGGGGFRPLRERFSFINCLNNVMPAISQMYPKFQSYIGRFDDGEDRWKTFFEGGTMMGEDLKHEWEILQQWKINLLDDIGEPIEKEKIKVISETATGFGKDNPSKLSAAIGDEFEFLKIKSLKVSTGKLQNDDPRGKAYYACNGDQFANTIFTAPITSKVQLTSSEFREAATNHMGLQSPLSMQTGIREIALTGNHSVTTDNYGHNLKNVTCVRGGHRTVFHNSIHSVIAQTLFNAGVNIKGKLPDTCANMFSHLLNRQGNNIPVGEETERMKQGIIPDIVILANPATQGTDPVNTIYDGKNTICDVKTLGPGQIYNTETTRGVKNSPVNKRQEQVHTEYYREARKLDAKFNETVEGDKGPVEEELLKYGQKGRVAGLVKLGAKLGLQTVTRLERKWVVKLGEKLAEMWGPM